MLNRGRANIRRATIKAARRAHRRRIYEWLQRVMYASLVLAGVAGVVQTRRFLLTTPRLALEGVNISGARRASPWEIRVLGEVDIGDNLLSLDVEQVAAGIRRHPWIERAKVRRALPDRLIVTVVEREPVAILAKESLFYVDRQGVLFKKIGLGERLDLPVLTGFEVPGPLQKAGIGRRVILEAIRLIEQIEAETSISRDAVSEVHVDLEHGFGFYTADSRAWIHLGWSEFGLKLRRLSRLLEGERLDLAQIKRLELDLKRWAVVTPM